MSESFSHGVRSAKSMDIIPPTGRERDRTARASIPIASTISGTEINTELRVATNLSGHRPRQAAVQIPSGTAISHANNMAVVVSRRVFLARIQSSGATGVL